MMNASRFPPVFSDTIHNFPRYAQPIHKLTPTSALLVNNGYSILVSTQRLNFPSVVLPGKREAKGDATPVA
jgi:hypothetical protein